MPITKTAKRALRVSQRKVKVNKPILSNVEIAVRVARKEKTKDAIRKASSLLDKAAQKHVIHKNKASRIKSILASLSKTKTASKEAPKTKGKAKDKKKK